MCVCVCLFVFVCLFVCLEIAVHFHTLKSVFIYGFVFSDDCLFVV